MHRRFPYRYRRPVQAPSDINISLDTIRESPEEKQREPDIIPLPNESEAPPLPKYSPKKSRRSNPLQGIFNRISIDELILLGLIFLFLDEGLDEMEDDFLFVILIYLLLAGRD